MLFFPIYASFLMTALKRKRNAAKEFAELEKMRTNWADFTSLDEEHWPAFMTVLAQLANLESYYFSFSYMLSKFSFRKENNIRDIYAQMRSELARIESFNQFQLPENIKGASKSVQQLASDFGRFLSIRSSLVEFYMLLPVREWRAFEENSYESACKSGLSFETNTEGAHSNALSKKELELLKLSYGIHLALQECNTIEALLMLKRSRDLLEDWFCSLDASPATKPSGPSFFLSFGSRRRSSVSRYGLLQFLLQFHHALVAKFSLYFHDTLVPFSPHNEIKQAFSNQVSFLQHFNTFGRKCNVHTICLLLNRIDQDKPFQGFGYHLCFPIHSSTTAMIDDLKLAQEKSLDENEPIRSRHVATKNGNSTQSGLSDKYPVLLFIPSERRHDHCHYATICSFVQEGCSGNGTTSSGTGNTTVGGNLSTSNTNLATETSSTSGNKIRYLYDKNKEQTFFTAHVEANIHLVITFERRVQERESAIHGFFSEALNNLRFTKLFQDIRNIGK